MTAQQVNEEEDETNGEGDAAITYTESPAEDLLREHGVSNRLLLIYEEGARRIQANEELPSDSLLSALDLSRRFLENFHFRLEENHVFPHFEAAESQSELITVLRRQHDVARRITQQLAQSIGAGATETASGRSTLQALLSSYVRMLRAHESRESTVIIPQMREVMLASAFSELYDAATQNETNALGPDGFHAAVDQIASLENDLGIRALEQFTAQV